MITRGELYWADLGPVQGSRPAKRRPVLVIQSDDYSRSRIGTVVVAVVTSNVALADWPGNVFLPSTSSGLPRDSVVNVTQIVTLDKADLLGFVAVLPFDRMRLVDEGLMRVLLPGPEPRRSGGRTAGRTRGERPGPPAG
uniref:type II toxin-antitoxin system PemK/MazF family toxin n=1 Tax=Georgenia subflava TaxID=1622177 RepID=UPI001D00E6E4|nr:type II toxin-antitoxin system PemK/MazF family toxin [Georgenia subflava]